MNEPRRGTERWWVVLVALLLAGLIGGCGPAEPAPGPQGGPTPVLSAPSPSAPPQPAAGATATPVVDLPPPEPAAWTRHLGINHVQGLAFAPDGTLWAATSGGAVRWDLAAGTPRHYTARDGLASDYVTGVAIAPAAPGGVETLWFSTLGGVSRFDGTTWTTYTTADGLGGDAVQAILVAPDGTVWAGTLEGVSRFDGQAWHSYLPGTRAWSLALGPDGQVWAAADAAGLGRYLPAQDAWQTYTAADGLPQEGVKEVGVGPDGDVWLYTGYDQVYRFDGQAWLPAYASAGHWVCGFAFAGETPWIATCGAWHALGAGLAYPEGEGWAHVTAGLGLASDEVLSVAMGPDGLVAAGTDRGLSVYRLGRWQTLRGGPLLDHASSVAVTPDGVVWLAFGRDGFPPPAGGVSRFDGTAWTYQAERDNVQMLAVDPAGSLWAAHGCALWHQADGGWQATDLCDRLMGNILDVAFGPAGGEMWVASGLALAHFDGQAWTAEGRLVQTVELGPGADGQGSVLWASGWDGSQGSDYVARYQDGQWARVLDARLGSLAVTPDGHVWGTAGEKGLAHYDGRAWTYVVPLASVVDLAVAPDGALWAAGALLARLAGDTWQLHALPAGWADAGITDLAFAPDGTAWLSTGRGALQFSPAESVP